MNPELQALLDKQAIAEVLYLYCRGCDRADEAAMRGCFHPGSTHRHGGFSGTSADFATFAMKIVRTTKMAKHLLTNVLVELQGDEALSESHYFAYHRRVSAAGAETDYFTGGRYLDRFERRNGVWGIVERLGLIDFERESPATHPGLGPQLMSGRYPEDALYRGFSYSGGSR